MRSNQNQLERFRSIAKKLVDDHSAEVFTRNAISSGSEVSPESDAYYHHLDQLGQELHEQARHFIQSYKTLGEDLKNQVWDTCRKYLDQFTSRNAPGYC